MNLLLLTGDEQFIRWLDSDKSDVVENTEQFSISTLTLTYPLSDVKDINEFKLGNKLFLLNGDGLKDCLYVINEQVESDLWKENHIKVVLEEVITELNYTPLVSMCDIPTKTVSVNTALLESFFGEWYNIGTVETGLLTNTIQIDGTMSRMELLRYIEEVTGNVFVTNYAKDTNTNKIIRTLHFKRPNNVGDNRDTVIDLGYNAENIIYNTDESDSYNAIAPILSWSEDSETSRRDMIALINNFKDLEIRKSTTENPVQVPFLFSEPVTSGVYPNRREGQLNSNYWRRVPGDSLYSWFPGLITNVTTVGATTSRTTMGDPTWTQNHKGYMLTCSTDGTYYYWNGTEQKTYTCVIGDIWICNGTSWKVIKKDNSGGNKPKYITVDTGLYNAPFNKKKGELYVSDTDNDTKIQYKNIYAKTNYNTPLVQDYKVVDPTTEAVETTDDYTEEDVTYTHHHTPKIGTISSSELNEIKLYNACCTALKEKRYPNIDITVDVKDITGNSYNLFDIVQVKIPNSDSLINCTVTKTEKNPHTPSENKITLQSQEVNGRYDLKTPYFVIEDSLHKHNTKFNFTGTLVELIPGEETVGSETVMTLTEEPVPNKWISIAVIKPQTTKTITEKTITTSTSSESSSSTTYWSKYGVSPNKEYVCGIGYTSTGADVHAWGTDYKGVFKNYCPNCKRSGGMRWNRGSRAKSGASQDGEFTCKYCDSDYSVEGNEKGSTHRKMTKYSLAKSNSTDSAKLLAGKLVYSTKTSKTTTTPSKTSTKTETVAGSTKLYSVKTDSNGSFTLPLKLEGLENSDYTVKCTFGGDETYNTCSDTCNITIPPVKNYTTVYEKSTSGGSKSTVTETNYNPISRGSSRTNCTNLKRQSGVVSKSVRYKARKIVGNKTGANAIKAIATWISENIEQSGRRNFYQSPAKTLSSGWGNCCCKTDLFMQMCEACNLSHLQTGGEYVLKYVHVPGHVYALVRHTSAAKGKYVDVSHKNWSTICKGYAPNGNSKTSSYPCLPFEREY